MGGNRALTPNLTRLYVPLLPRNGLLMRAFGFPQTKVHGKALLRKWRGSADVAEAFSRNHSRFRRLRAGVSRRMAEFSGIPAYTPYFGFFTKLLRLRSREGTDGRVVAIPPGGTSREGRDRRVTAIKHGGTSREGRDGRVVGIPKGYSSKEGSDGRVVAVPRGRRAAEGPNGRVRLLPK